MSHRISTRWDAHDYRNPGWYFVTICTLHRRPVLGALDRSGVTASKLGQLVSGRWADIARRSPFAKPHDYILMPDHLHGIVEISEATDAIEPADDSRRFGPLQHRSVGVVVNLLKGDVTQEAWRRGVVPAGTAIWQRGYYDRIFRNRRHLDRVRAYIRDNPIRASSPP